MSLCILETRKLEKGTTKLEKGMTKLSIAVPAAGEANVEGTQIEGLLRLQDIQGQLRKLIETWFQNRE